MLEQFIASQKRTIHCFAEKNNSKEQLWVKHCVLLTQSSVRSLGPTGGYPDSCGIEKRTMCENNSLKKVNRKQYEEFFITLARSSFRHCETQRKKTSEQYSLRGMTSFRAAAIQ